MKKDTVMACFLLHLTMEMNDSRKSSPGEGSEHNSENSVNRPTLTQDCIVWDESNNVDLRRLASPNFETPSSGDTARKPTARRRQSLNEVSRILPGGAKAFDVEQEVDSIFSRLGTDGGAPTQKLSNCRPPLDPHQSTDQQRQQHGFGIVTRRKRPREGPELAPKAPPSASQLSVRRLSTGQAADEFAQLLQQVQTPSPSTDATTSRSRDDSAVVGETIAPAATKENIGRNGSQSATTHPVETAKKSPTIEILTNARTIVPGRPPLATTGLRTRPALTVVAVPPILPSPPPSLAHRPAATPVAATLLMPPPRPVQSPPTDDEFGSVDFSGDDFAFIDSLVGQATQPETSAPAVQNVVNSCPFAEDPEDVFGDFPDIDFDALEQSIVQQKSEGPAANNPSRQVTAAADDDDDAFGAFPEFDFDALEKSLVQAESITAVNDISPADCRVCNKQTQRPDSSELSGLCFSRYKVVRVNHDVSSFTRTLQVAAWQPNMKGADDSKALHRSDLWSKRLVSPNATWPVDGVIHLRGEWYHTQVAEGDVIHICSLSGAFCTNKEALPLILHTSPPPGSVEDDLVLIVHPDMLLTPTGISETISCTRRAILKNRLGSTGLTSRAPLFGTMRHELFEETMKERDFTIQNARKHVQQIVRRNAEGLIACGVTDREAELEVLKVVPQLQRFATDYTKLSDQQASEHFAILESSGSHPPIRFVANSVEAIEDTIVSPGLGLKGNIDMVVEATTGLASASDEALSRSYMSVELKTSHYQRTQPAHMAQLALYTLMLQERYGLKSVSGRSQLGALHDGVLLYLNNDDLKAVHLSPMRAELKSLIGQRNVVAIESAKASRVRGVVLTYQSETLAANDTPKVDLLEATPPALPDLVDNLHACQKCYANRECMMYAGVARAQQGAKPQLHDALLAEYTGHLSKADFAYFRNWDRLVDLEADAGRFNCVEAWLTPSLELEVSTSKCIGSLRFNAHASMLESSAGGQGAVISFSRSPQSPLQTPLESLNFEPGCHVIVSCDTTVFGGTGTLYSGQSTKRSQMHLLRGTLRHASGAGVLIYASSNDWERVRRFMTLYASSEEPHFRVDRDDVATGIGTLRQNLLNLFVGDTRQVESNRSSQSRPRSYRRLREIIVNLARPAFASDLESQLFVPRDNLSRQVTALPGCSLDSLAAEFHTLNPDQKAAAARAFAAMDYGIIQGLPGTGKSSTIAFVARLLAAHGQRVLITSYTHAAVDNVLLKLMEKGVASTADGRSTPTLIRIGRESLSHGKVHDILASNVAKGIDTPGCADAPPSANALGQCISAARIVGVSALSIPRSPLLVHEEFDVVIVDEAGQISQPAIIGALMKADRFVLIGDHMQLPPLVTSELAEKGGYGVSMLKHLAEGRPESVARLTLQYRMNEDICQLSNEIVYKGTLKCANEVVRSRRLNLQGFPENLQSLTAKAWLVRAIDPSCPVTFVNTDRLDASGKFVARSTERLAGRNMGGSIINDGEAFLVEEIVSGLLQCGLNVSNACIICPFRAQLRLLAECPSLNRCKDDGLEISTIDRFQGRDKDVVIMSFVRSNSKGRVGRLLEDYRRLNVAVTRAKSKLILVGSFATLKSGSEPLRPSLERLLSQGHVWSVPEETLAAFLTQETGQ